jgi:hypothetical protein
MTQPRAADDFRVIRARMEELRRERAQVPPERDAQQPSRRSYHAVASVFEDGRSRQRLRRAIRQKLFAERARGATLNPTTA